MWCRVNKEFTEGSLVKVIPRVVLPTRVEFDLVGSVCESCEVNEDRRNILVFDYTTNENKLQLKQREQANNAKQMSK